MRSLMLVAPLLLLSGCNLFRSGLIPQTCEDLPRGCDGTIDTQPIDDTGDTAPWIPEDPATSGVVLVSKTDDGVQLRARSPSGELLASAEIAAAQAPDPGPVVYDPDTNRILMWDNEVKKLFVLVEGTEAVKVGADPGLDVDPGFATDALVVDTEYFLVAGDQLWSYPQDAEFLTALPSNSAISDIRSVFPAYEDNLFLLDWGSDGTPDLYRHTISTQESRLSYEDYDDSFGRSISGFRGPTEMPHVCSTVGGVYTVEVLQSDERTPAAFPLAADLEESLGVEMLSGVTDCGWDHGSEQFLLHSVDHGVLRMDPWGRVRRTLAPATDETLIRAAFFTVADGSTD
jgi:hypothetical protein